MGKTISDVRFWAKYDIQLFQLISVIDYCYWCVIHQLLYLLNSLICLYILFFCMAGSIFWWIVLLIFTIHFKYFDYNVFKFRATTSLSVSSLFIYTLGTRETYKKPILDFSIFLKVEIDLWQKGEQGHFFSWYHQ